MAVSWEYYDNDKFSEINDKYLPSIGEGDTKASQIVTAVNKLVYKWYNDGDVFDNTYYLEGWGNNLSSYANWLSEHTNARSILSGISNCMNDSDYENLLRNLADTLINEQYLAEQNKIAKVGSIYDCAGVFEFNESYDDYDYDDDDDWW